MKRSFKLLVFLLLAAAFLVSGCYQSKDTNKNEILKIPQKNKVELDKVWELNTNGEISRTDIQGNILYAITDKQVIYIIDIGNGKLIKSFKAKIDEELPSDGISIYEGALAIFYPDELYILDMESEKVLLHKKVGLSGTYTIYGMYLYKDIVIYSDMRDEKIYAINYKTGNNVWDFGEELDKRGHFRLYKYKDRYLFRNPAVDSYYEYNPLTGEILNSYKFELGEEIANEDLDFYMPIFDNIEDKEFENWLKSETFDVFILTTKGYMYADYGNKFYFHGVDSDLDWMVKPPKEISLTYDYGRYTFLDQTNSISLLDLEHKEILWNEDFNNDNRISAFIHESKLYVSVNGEKGSQNEGKLFVYDLSKLEQ